jgi:hypothetical protein
VTDPPVLAMNGSPAASIAFLRNPANNLAGLTASTGLREWIERRARGGTCARGPVVGFECK